MSLDSIKTELRLLSSEELLELLRLTSAILETKRSKQFPVELEFAYRGLSYPLSLHVKIPPNLGVLKADMQKEVVSAIDFLFDWLKSILNGPVTRTQIQPIFGLFGQLLVEFLQLRQVPLSLVSFVRQTRTIPGLVDQAFPGYISNGLFPLVVDALFANQGNGQDEIDEV